MQVLKRDGGLQPLDLNKIHAVIEWACNGDRKNNLGPIKGVSVSQVEMSAHLHLHDGISTKDIHETLIKSAESLISEDTPNYDHVAARLRWFSIRKETFGENDPPHILDVVELNTVRGKYDPDLASFYSKEEWDQINSFIDHSRDDLFRYAGIEQIHKKYLVQDRQTKVKYETAQMPYILVAAVIFKDYPKETRLSFIKDYYDTASQHYISLPTPMMAGLRTKVKQFSSCTVIEAGDSLKSINAAAAAIVEYASRKAGIGLSIGGIRAKGQPVRGGDAITTGILPFSKYFNAALKSSSQGAIRSGSGTFNYPIWHLEWDTLIELKNDKGTDETRLRTVDYCVHLNRVMIERLLTEGDITFFSPEEVPDLYQAFYGPADEFRKLYVQYEADPSKTKKVQPAKEVFAKLVSERYETGRIYIMFADLANTNTPFYEKIRLSNLCMEILLPTTPMGEDDSQIALCTLSALNWGKIDTEEQMEVACRLAVRALDEVLSYQEYPNEAAKRSTLLYRPLGVGIIGFAHWLAKNNLRWGAPETLEAVRNKVDSMAYHLTRASCDLAKEKGACPARTRYHDGIFPAELVGVKLSERWEVLREDLKKYGIRNATLMAAMPSETSSQLANETNGIEPPRSLVTIKGNGENNVPQVVPEFAKLNHVYETAWNIQVPDYLATIAELQKYFDQAISSNTTYNPHRNKVTTQVLLEDLILTYKLRLKTLYYSNVLDQDNQQQEEDEGCADGACKI